MGTKDMVQIPREDALRVLEANCSSYKTGACSQGIKAHDVLIRALGLPKLEKITFMWSREHGDCYDCGRPAAYYVDTATPETTHQTRYCSVCAAVHAADGETIMRLAREE